MTAARIADQIRLLELWHALELFAPRQIEAANVRGRIWDAPDRSGHLPWMAGHDATAEALTPGRTWRHIVYCGLFPIASITSELTYIFGDDGESFDSRPVTGVAATAGFVVAADGVVVPDSLVVSTCAWACGRARDPGPADAGWLQGFDEAVEAIAEELAELAGVAAEVDVPALEELERFLARRLNVADSLAPKGSRVRTISVKETEVETPTGDSDLLNSFFVKDLRRVIDDLRDGPCRPPLDTYLSTPTADDRGRRHDVRRELDDVLERLAPAAVPAGRWPDAPQRPLASSQQFAVVTALNTLGGAEGSFAVNGPPGTGKTTMLRDLIAAIVVERATRLVDFEDPQDAFTDEIHRWRTTDFERRVRRLRPELVGHEIVVASANNGAVENVSREIPGAGEIAAEWQGATDYFRELGSHVLEASTKTGAARVSAWGLVAARLGRMSNCGEFYRACWFGKIPRKDVPDVVGLEQRLRTLRSRNDPDAAAAATAAWKSARSRFLAQAEQVTQMREARQALWHALSNLAPAERQLDELAEQLAAAEAGRRQAAEAGASAQTKLDLAGQELRLLEANWETFQATRPGRLARMLGRDRAWRDVADPLATELTATRAMIIELGRAFADASTRLRGAEEAVEDLARRHSAAAECVGQLRARIADRPEAWGEHVPDRWTDRDDGHRELTAPWLDEEWNRSRSELFLEALSLHRAFIEATADTMYGNLKAAMEVVNGHAPDAREAVHAAWQSLFLLVPVVSTTFASLGRMFAQLGAGTLGWLLIDEAGQTVPQAAVGGLWRAKRAVMVGDPRQVEPVFVAPFTAQRRLRAHFDVPERWLPSRASVQTLADELNPFGTSLPGDPDPLWVGAPLRVHRRCIDPMVSISNQIAYDGLMIPAAVERADPWLPKSCWYDVRGPAEGHWRPEQAQAARDLVRDLEAAWRLDPSEIFVISPFRAVANRLREQINRRARVGTIHTAQGTQAAVVVLVLAGDPAKPRAKSFATDKPNVLNVAVTRAQRRLYVVGDYADWSGMPHLDVAARALERSPWPPSLQ